MLSFVSGARLYTKMQIPYDDWLISGEVPDDVADPPLNPTGGIMSWFSEEYLCKEKHYGKR